MAYIVDFLASIMGINIVYQDISIQVLRVWGRKSTPVILVLLP